MFVVKSSQTEIKKNAAYKKLLVYYKHLKKNYNFCKKKNQHIKKQLQKRIKKTNDSKKKWCWDLQYQQSF